MYKFVDSERKCYVPCSPGKLLHLFQNKMPQHKVKGQGLQEETWQASR
jgi:hypothetical protein